VKERGRQIMETTDPEGYQAMQATLSMLTDKIDSLQAMADDKAKILQVMKTTFDTKFISFNCRNVSQLFYM